MNKLVYYLLFFLLITSCADFIEYPLEKESVELKAPADDLSTRDSVITFWWNTHQDAKYYRIQIVSPSFENSAQLILDSLVDKNQFQIELNQGEYQWQARPENDGSVGLFQERRTLRIIK
ncbi:hypothetical protein [Sphingobacterium endophyticum]|uniref:hypothetical protein n=1 Tax=Sphingobacterium endophyticum TaxID=2546448 RepID=UPI0012E3037E|nr:hypothetical protein [Sphingobacterium endophyticum]